MNIASLGHVISTKEHDARHNRAQRVLGFRETRVHP